MPSTLGQIHRTRRSPLTTLSRSHITIESIIIQMVILVVISMSLQHILEGKWVDTLDSTLLQGLLHPGNPQQDTAQPVKDPNT